MIARERMRDEDRGKEGGTKERERERTHIVRVGVR